MKDSKAKEVKIIVDGSKIIYIEIHHSTTLVPTVSLPFRACSQLKPPHCGGRGRGRGG